MARDDGIHDFAARMAKLPESIRKGVNKAIAINAAEWVRVSKSVAPKDPADGTPLHDSIRSEVSATGGQIVRAGGLTTTVQNSAGRSDYAIHQEFGTREMPSSPFFWPVYRSFKKRWNGRRSRALSKAFKEFNQ